VKAFYASAQPFYPWRYLVALAFSRYPEDEVLDKVGDAGYLLFFILASDLTTPG